MAKSSLWVFSGGWVYWPTPHSEVEVRVRFKERSDGRFEAVDIWVAKPGGLSASELRRVPLGKIEAAVNSPAVAAELRERMNAPHAMPERELSKLKNRLAPEGPPQLDLTVWPLEFAKLEIPTDRRKPDSFYRHVGEVYAALAPIDRHPAVVIAAQNDVPVTTVHRWLKEARARGLLGPARRMGRNQPAEETAE